PRSYVERRTTFTSGLWSGSERRATALRGLVVRVPALGVLRRVDDAHDLGNHLANTRFAAVLERHVDHATALAAATELDEHHAFANVDQRHEAAVRSDGRIDLVVEHALHRDSDRIGPKRVRVADL